MNFISALIGSDSASVSERIEAKKTIFCVGDELEIHKLIYGLFLDGFKPKAGEKTAYDNLSKYEFFAGSLTWNRMRKELQAYLNSELSLNLHKETRAQLQEFVELLQESHELNQLIDLYRSSDLRLLFLTATGKGASIACNTINLEPDQLGNLTSSALKKVGSLEVGQKAIFLMGTILHETLLHVERLDENRFKLRYYDSAVGKMSRIIGLEALLKETFWNDLYNSKFSAYFGPSQYTIDKHLSALEKPEESDRDDHNYFTRRQKNNTCHFRCLLAFWKDQILSNPKLTVEEAYLEWNLSKVGFGEFALKSEHLQNEQLARFSQRKQAKRTKRQKRAFFFSDCIRAQKVQETLQAYLDLMNAVQCDPVNRKVLKSYSSGNPLKDLVKAEQELLGMLMSYLVTPKTLVHFFEHIENPWLLESLELYKERWIQRRKDFQEELHQELVSSESLGADAFKYSALEILQKMDIAFYYFARDLGIQLDITDWSGAVEPALGASLYENEVQDLLDLFENTIQRLRFLNRKPCFINVLAQAVQLGKIRQVERIFRQLSTEDQNRFCQFCASEACGFFIPALPKTIKNYLLEDEGSRLTSVLSTYYCKKAWQSGKFSDFFNIADALEPLRSLDVFVQASIASMPWEEILEILTAMESYPEQDSIPYSASVFSGIEELLLESGNKNLIDQARKFNIRNLEPILDTITLGNHYKEGNLEQIQTLGLHRREEIRCVLRGMHFFFSLENYKLGLQLLSETASFHFGWVLGNDLLKSGCKLNSEEIVLSVLASFTESLCCKQPWADWYGLEFNEKLFILKTLSAQKNQKENKLLKLIATNVLFWANAKDFEAVCKVFEAVDPELIASITNEGIFTNFDEIIHISNQSSLAKFLGKRLCLRYLSNMNRDKGLLSRVEVYQEEERPRFLTGWYFTAQDFDPTDQKSFYQNAVKPLFEHLFDPDYYGPHSLEVVLDLLKDIPSAEVFRPLIAMVWVEKGLREEALKICPDAQRLEEARVGLLSE